MGLFRSKVVPNPRCDNCDSAAEDSLHALWTCPALCQTWTTTTKVAEFRNKSYNSLYDLINKIASSITDLALELFAVVSWSIWHNRNQARLHPPYECFAQIGLRARAYLQEYLEETKQEKKEKSCQPQVGWRPPELHCYKVNFDGAIFKETNEGGIGMVIHDSLGRVNATLSQKIKSGHSVEMIEALAAKRAISFTLEVGLCDIELEGDAEIIIKAITRHELPHNAYGLVLEDAKALLPLFQHYLVSYTCRSGNTVAHALARQALHIHSLLVWMEEVPPDILHVLSNDSLVSSL
uniref:RNase H type-1 domain-containing protein n=1 Tax=Fagus sylvatica TaxID=28930 RepID=A0A2N9ILC7_FAGSY